MATDKQITANRQNAAKSTGPQSQSGKSRASRNALKHGLSAEQVVMFDEDPAVFEALRSDLFAHFQPADPVADHLVEQVAACIWRLRRVPEIETRICAYYRLVHESRQAAKRAESCVIRDEYNANIIKFRDREAREAAEVVCQHAEAKLLDDEPLMGGRSLTSLVRIAGAIESSMYRAIRELERIKAERPTATNGNAVIDVEADEEEDWLN